MYSRDGLEWSGEHLLEHVGLGPGNGIVVSDECRLPSQLSRWYSLLVASPLLALLPPAQHHQQRGQREGEREHWQTNLKWNIVLKKHCRKISCLGSVLSILYASF